jgi:hypothetical protein
LAPLKLPPQQMGSRLYPVCCGAFFLNRLYSISLYAPFYTKSNSERGFGPFQNYSPCPLTPLTKKNPKHLHPLFQYAFIITHSFLPLERMVAHELLRSQLATSVLSRLCTKLFFFSKGWYAFWTYTGLFKIIVRVLTTCHTQYT